MKITYLTIVSILSLFIISCNVYQVSTVASSDARWKLNQDSAFILKDSLFDLLYTFNTTSPNNMEAAFKVNNTSDKEVVFNWDKSAFILNGQSFSLGNTVIKTNGQFSTESNSIKWSKSYSSTSGSGVSSSVSTMSPKSTFIPPHSYIESEKQNFTVSYLQNLQLKNTPQIITLKSDTMIDNSVSTIYGDLFHFNEDNTPYQIRIYLTYSILNANGTVDADKIFTSNFYVDQLLQVKRNPATINTKARFANNKFITTQQN